MPDKYQKWRSKLPKGLQWEGDYNLRGLYNSNPNATPSGNLHFPDTYKLGNHPTYSTQSQGWYNQPWLAGQWSEQPNGPMMNDVYTPFNSVYKQQLVEPHQFKQGGVMPKGNKKVQPVYVNSKNDPRYKAYQDSLSAYNLVQKELESIKNDKNQASVSTIVKKPKNQWKAGIQENWINQEYTSKYPNNIPNEYYGRVNPDGVDYAAFMPAYKKPVQPVVLGRPKDNIRPLSPSGPQNSYYPNQSLSYLSIPNQQAYQPSPMGEAVYAQGGENMPLLGYYNSQEGFIPDTTNPDSQQYLQNKEYMQNLIKRNYGSDYEQKRDGGKMKKFSGKKGQYGLGIKPGDTIYPAITDMQQLQANPMQMMQVQQTNQQLQQLPEQYNPNIPAPQNQGTQRQQNKPWGFTTPGTGSLIAGAVGLANAVIPYDNGQSDRKRQYGGYNPYSQGIAGSQAIYEDGGMFPGGTINRKRKVGGFSVTEEIPNNLGTAAVQQPVNSTVRNQPKSLSYERVGADNSYQMYTPQFNGNWNQNDIKQEWNNIPSTINGLPVARGQQWNDLQKPINSPIANKPSSNVSYSNNYQTIDSSGVHYRGYYPNNLPQYSFEEGGNLSVGQEIELSDEEIARLEKMGYKFKK